MNAAAKASQNTYPPNRYPQGTRYSHRRNADANRYLLHRSAQLASIAFGWSVLLSGAHFTGFCIGMLGDVIFLL